MTDRTSDHDRKVLGILQRRLQKRELQAASYGMSADPSISIEIEDLRKETRSLEWKIDRHLGNRHEVRNGHLMSMSTIISEENDTSAVKFDLTGNWRLEEIYEFGRTTADVHIRQRGNHISGEMTIKDSMDNGEVEIIEEGFSGRIRETTIFLYGEYVLPSTDYELDQWIGIIKDDSTIEGNSEDIGGATGKFVMKRIL